MTTVDALQRRTSLGYDAANRMTQCTDARGYRTTFGFDDAGHLTSRRYLDGTRVTMAYDAIGQRTVLSDLTGRTTSIYDDGSRVRTVTNSANKRLTYSYDAVNERTRLIEPGGGRFTTSYDAAGQRKVLTNPQSERTTFSFDDAGKETLQRLASGCRISTTYDDAGRLKRVTNLNGAMTTLSSFQYLLDAAGNRTGIKEASGDRVTLSYDTTYQLTRERRSGANSFDVTYSYDKVGNRKTKDESGVRTTTTYDAGNQIVWSQNNTGRTTHTFDQAGNQTRTLTPGADRTTYVWDYENRLSGIRLPSGTRNTFLYDGDDKRVQAEDSSGTTKSIWDLENILQETDGSNVTQATFTLWPALYADLVSQRRGSTTNFFLFDGLGSTDRLTDASGGVTDSYLYYAFGGLKTSSGATTNRFRYIGRHGYFANLDFQEYHVRARYYSPIMGRFLSHDPIEWEENLYRYVHNRPAMFIDPSGLWAVWLVPTAIVGGSAAVGAFAYLTRRRRGVHNDLGPALAAVGLVSSTRTVRPTVPYATPIFLGLVGYLVGESIIGPAIEAIVEAIEEGGGGGPGPPPIDPAPPRPRTPCELPPGDPGRYPECPALTRPDASSVASNWLGRKCPRPPVVLSLSDPVAIPGFDVTTTCRQILAVAATAQARIEGMLYHLVVQPPEFQVIQRGPPLTRRFGAFNVGVTCCRCCVGQQPSQHCNRAHWGSTQAIQGGPYLTSDPYTITDNQGTVTYSCSF